MPAPPAFASHPPWRGIPFALLELAPGLAAIAVVFALSGGATTAESIEVRQIGLLIGLGLAGLGAWAGWRCAAPGAAFVPLALLALPAGTGAVVAAAILAASLLWSLAAAQRQASTASSGHLLWRACGLAFSVQTLLRPTYLLPWNGNNEVTLELIGFPVAAALALTLLHREFGESRALLAAGSMALVGPGFGGPALLALVALSLAPQLRPNRPAWRRAITLAALLAVCLAETRWGILALLAALAVAFPSPLARFGLPLGAAVVALAVRLRGVEETLPLFALGLVCVPTWFFVERAGIAARTGAAALAFAGLLAMPAAVTSWAPEGNPLAALAPALGIVALGAPAVEKRDRFQLAWCAGLLAAVTLFAAYPWLRATPLAALAEAANLNAATLAAVALAAGALALVRTPPWFRNGLPWVLGAAFLLQAKPWEVHPIVPPAGEQWQVELPSTARRVAVISQLANAAELSKGSVVARLRARGGDGGRLVFPIRAGFETGEWAARRPQMRELAGGLAPSAYRSRFTAGGEIGQSYRASFDLDGLAPPVTIEIARDAVLAPSIVFEVFSVTGLP